jgi:protein-tyrosine phosphatase
MAHWRTRFIMINTRYLDWPDLSNARDLGGLPARDGRVTRRAAFVRSDGLHNMTAGGFEALLAHGIRTVIDLRTSGELTRLPNPAADRPEINFVAVSLLGGSGDPQFVRDANLPPHVEWAEMMIEHARPRIADVMRAIADAPDGGVLFHCHVGKDRTGLVADILLDLAGVPEQVIADDYELSNERLLSVETNPRYAALADEQARLRYAGDARIFRQTAHAALAAMRRIGGNTHGYLREIGLTPEQLTRIQARMLD